MDMAVPQLKSFADVQRFISQVLSENGQRGALQSAPHQAFWTTLTYDQFVNGTVPGVTDPNTGQPMPILVKGKSAQSNLILSLQGVGAIFGPDGAMGQMPANGPPFFTPDQISAIAMWIDSGCPR
jgi:hypothetical protein